MLPSLRYSPRGREGTPPGAARQVPRSLPRPPRLTTFFRTCPRPQTGSQSSGEAKSEREAALRHAPRISLLRVRVRQEEGRPRKANLQSSLPVHYFTDFASHVVSSVVSSQIICCNALIIRLEAEAGIEPANGSFADFCLTTWLLRRCAGRRVGRATGLSTVEPRGFPAAKRRRGITPE
jgi:hypothetical protein